MKILSGDEYAAAAHLHNSRRWGKLTDEEIEREIGYLNSKDTLGKTMMQMECLHYELSEAQYGACRICLARELTRRAMERHAEPRTIEDYKGAIAGYEVHAYTSELEAKLKVRDELYRAAWEECDWHRGRESICNEPRWPDACMAHDALRAKHGVEENAQ